MDSLVASGGFEQLADVGLVRFAREAAELVAAHEHRSLLDTRDTDRWLRLEPVLRERLRAYVASHETEFFSDSAEARAIAERVEASLAAEAESVTRRRAEIDRDVAGQEWLVRRFGDRGIYSQASELLLLRPNDMREAIRAAKEAGYQPHEFAFYREADGSPELEATGSDPFTVLDAGVERHAAAWVAVELGSSR